MVSRRNQRELKVVVAGDSRQFEQALASASKSASQFDQRMEATSAALGKLALPIAAVGAAGVKAFADFDQALTESLAIMGDVSSSTRELLESTAREVAKTTTFSAEQAAEAYFFLASAGLDAQQSIAALPQVAEFAQAGMFDLATATDLLTDAQSALGLTSEDTQQNLLNMERVADVFVKANTLANTSVQQISEALTNKAGGALRAFEKDVEEGAAVLAAFADQGVKGAEAGEKLSIILRDVTRAAVANSGAFREFGINVLDADGNLRNLADVVAEFERELGSLPDAQRAAALEQLGLTRAVGDSITQLLGTSDAIRGYESDLRNAAGTTAEIADKQLESLNAQLELAKSQLIDAAITIGEDLAPVVLELAENVGDLADAWSSLDDETRSSVVELGKMIVTLFAVTKGVTIAKGAITGLVAAFGSAGAAIAGFATAPFAALATLPESILSVEERLRIAGTVATDATGSASVGVQGFVLEAITAAEAVDELNRNLAELDDARTSAQQLSGEMGNQERAVKAASDRWAGLAGHYEDIERQRVAEQAQDRAEALEEEAKAAADLEGAVIDLAESFAGDLRTSAQDWLDIFSEAPELEVVGLDDLQTNLDARIEQTNSWLAGLDRLEELELDALFFDFAAQGPESAGSLEALLADIDAGGERAFTLNDTLAAAQDEVNNLTTQLGLELARNAEPLIADAQALGVDISTAIAQGMESVNVSLAITSDVRQQRYKPSRFDADSGGRRNRAGGGPVYPGTPYIVGENRPEVFVPDVAGRIVPSMGAYQAQLNRTGVGAGGGPTVVVNVDARGASDPNRVAYKTRRQVSRELRIYQSGADRRS